MRKLRFFTILPVLMILISILVGCEQYFTAKEKMRQDLNQALHHLVMDASQQGKLMKTIDILPHDMTLTLSGEEYNFNKQLAIGLLRDTSHISLCLLKDNKVADFHEQASISSDTLLWVPEKSGQGRPTVAIKAFANPSLASVLGHSGLHWSFSGLLLGMLLLSFLYTKTRKKEIAIDALPTPPLSTGLHLTPMQEQLITLFTESPDHILSKEAICEALWPKKDHPEDTLYTFISRMKASLRKQSDMDIINRRGKEYQLIKEKKKNEKA